MIAIDYDFQGWPIYAHTLREVLIALGGTVDENGNIVFKGDDKLLDAYPQLFEDDGMGYGVNEKYVTEVDKEMWDTNLGEAEIKAFNIFTDKQATKEKLQKIQEDMDALEEKIKNLEIKKNKLFNDEKSS